MSLGDGNDSLTGLGSASTIDGGAGDDTLSGSWTSDVFYGGPGNDTIKPAGSDTVNGGADVDTVTYAGLNNPIQVSLDDVANDGDYVYASPLANIKSDVENFTGGSGDDIFVGSTSANTFVGNGGVDFVSYSGRSAPVWITNNGVVNDGAPGELDNISADVESMLGGSGNDTITGAGSSNTIDGGLGNDTLSVGVGSSTLSYASHSNGVNVSLDGVANDGQPGEQDVLVGDFRTARGGPADDTLTAGSAAGMWTLYGDGGNDTIYGNSSGDWLYGGYGNDTINGGASNDNQYGGDGDDTLLGGAGPDNLQGENGNDLMDGGADGDTYNGGAGFDTVSYSSRSASLTVGFNNYSSGESGEGDYIYAYYNEKVIGGSGNDTITGDSYPNTFDGGPGADTLSGLGGDDTFLIRDGWLDTVTCGANNDSVTADFSDSVGGDCESTTRDDPAPIARIISGPADGSTVYNTRTPAFSFEGNSSAVSFECKIDSASYVPCAGTYVAGTLVNGQHSFSVRAVDSNGVAGGAAATRTFTINLSAIAYTQGSIMYFEAAAGQASNLQFSGTSGFYHVKDVNNPIAPTGSCSAVSANEVKCPSGSVTSFSVSLGDGNDTLAGTLSTATIDGGAGDDVLSGTYTNDIISGGDGNDTILPAGSDVVNGGSGSDTVSFATTNSPVQVSLDNVANDGYAPSGQANVKSDVENITGGPHDDIFVGSLSANTFVGNGGTDFVSYADRSAPVTLANNGVANDGISGELDNIGADVESMLGGSGNDTITGAGSSNTIDGGFGNDTLAAGTGSSTLSYASHSTGVNVSLDGVVNDGQPGEQDIISGVFRTARGGSADDTLTAGSAAGMWTLYGDGGNDTIYGNSSGDWLYGGSGNDTIDGGASNDYQYGGDGDDNLSGGSGADYLDAGNGDDKMDGGAGTDTLYGMAGFDTVDYSTRTASVTINLTTGYGGESGENDGAAWSNEKFVGGSGNDSFTGSSAANVFEGGAGSDTLNGAGGADIMLVRDGVVDQVVCGTEADTVESDFSDSINADCETTQLPGTATINLGPADDALISDSTPSFTFSTSGAGQLECSLDTAAFSACASPYTTNVLADGSHTFRVRARDIFGNVDPTPPSRTFTVDATAPVTVFLSGPADGSTISTTSTSFSWSSEPAVTYMCSVDGEPWTACPDTISLSDLAAGQHQVSVFSTDVAGNEETPPISRTFSVAAVQSAPDTTIVSGPEEGSVTNEESPAFELETDTGTSFECRIDSDAWSACTSPAEVGPLDDGEYVFSARAENVQGSIDETPAARTFTVDTQSPETFIVGSPDAEINDTTPSFEFEANEEATYECSIDGSEYASCGAVVSTDELSDGEHTLSVVAIDSAGNRDVTPDTTDFVVDTQPPDTEVNAPFVNGQTISEQSFSIELVQDADETLRFECQIDEVAPTDCSSPWTIELLDGTHNLTVQAIDEAGNVDSTPYEMSVIITSLTPHAIITSGPQEAGYVAGDMQTFEFEAVGSNGFECQVDNGDWTECASPFTTPELIDGTHTFAVRATDVAGTLDDPSTRSFTVDNVGPETTIDRVTTLEQEWFALPVTNPLNSSDVVAFVTSDEPRVSYECNVDGGGYSACTAVNPYSGEALHRMQLADGSHSLLVRAVDQAGNADDTPDLHQFDVDSSVPNDGAPDTSIGFWDPTVDPMQPFDHSVITFHLMSTPYASYFECSVDDSAYRPCSYRFVTSTLANGSHTVRARAVDRFGVVDTTPAEAIVDVDVAGNDAAPLFDQMPPAATHASQFVTAFHSEAPGATFECQLDDETWSACVSPHTRKLSPQLVEGVHVFRVRAISDGRVGSVVSADVAIDRSSPSISIDDSPGSSPVSINEAEFSFSSNDAEAVFRCALDGGAFSTCTTPATYTGLSDGPHTFAVGSIDPAGNQSQAAYSLFSVDTGGTAMVDTTPPDTEIVTGPGDGATTVSQLLSYGFAVTEPASFECKLDDGPFVGCLSQNVSYTVGDGNHIVYVRAIDVEGNVDPTPAQRSVIVDSTAPAAPTIGVHPAPVDGGDAAFTFTSAESSFECKLDEEPWVPCTGSPEFSGLAEGTHALSVRVADQAGNWSLATLYSWTVDAGAPTSPTDVTIVQPEEGSLYLEWQPGSDFGNGFPWSSELTHSVRYCIHRDYETCGTTQTESGLGYWRGWQTISASRTRTDEIYDVWSNSNGNDGWAVDYEIRAEDGAGNTSEIVHRTLGEQNADHSQISITGGSLPDSQGEYVSEDDDLTVNVTARDIGPGILRMGLGCTGRWVDDVLLTCLETQSEDQEFVPRYGQWDLAHYDAPCVDGQDPFAPGKKTCPQEWSSTFSIPASELTEYAQDMFVWVEDRAHSITVRNFNPILVDKSAPTEPSTVDVSVEDGLLLADWDNLGDPSSGEDPREGSGVERFEVRHRTDESAWSSPSSIGADEPWTVATDIAGAFSGSNVDFEIVAVDDVGHRSQPVVTSTIATTAGPDDTASEDEDAILTGIAADWPNSSIQMYGYWVTTEPGAVQRIQVETSLYPGDTDQNNPGDPLAVRSRTCHDVRACELVANTGYLVGTFKSLTRVFADDGGGYQPIGSNWSDSYHFVEIPADLGEGDLDDAYQITDPSGPSGSAQAASATPYFKGCFRKWTSSPVFSTTQMKQYQCRYGASVDDTKRYTDNNSSSAKRLGFPDDGRPRAYPRLPNAYRQWKEPRKFIKSGKSFPLYDSLGFRRLRLRSINRGRHWEATKEDGTKLSPFASSSVKTKLQGRACMKKPGAKNSEYVLFSWDTKSVEVRTRLFVSIKAFPRAIHNYLRKAGTGCSSKGSSTFEKYDLRNPGISGLRFYQSDRKARTSETYNVRPVSNTFYISSNTNSVFQGGIVRSVIPSDFAASGLSFALIAFNDYCDSNAFSINPATGTLDQQPGLQWAYGSVLRNGVSTGIRGWVPMASLVDPAGNPPPSGTGQYEGKKCPTSSTHTGS